MMNQNSIVIYQTEEELCGAVYRVGAVHNEMIRYAHVACPTPELICIALKQLFSELLNGQVMCLGSVRVCLHSDVVFFREWSFPFKSRKKIKQALSLALESEFPFPTSRLEHRILKAKNSKNGINRRIITISMSKDRLALWENAFAFCGLSPTLLTVSPFPLLAGLPKQDGEVLVIQLNAHSIEACILKNGSPERLRYIPLNWSDVVAGEGDPDSNVEIHHVRFDRAATIMARHVEMALAGASKGADRLLLFGDSALQGQLASSLGDILGLPVSVIGRDLPLAGQLLRANDDGMDRLLLHSLARPGLIRPRPAIPLPSFHHEAATSMSVILRHQPVFEISCVALLLVLSVFFAFWAEGYAWKITALRYENKAKEIFQEAVPGIHKSYTTLQMKSILEEKISKSQRSDNINHKFLMLKRLRDIHAATPKEFEINIDKIILDQNSCELDGSASSYDLVDRFQKFLSEIAEVDGVNIVRAVAKKNNDISFSKGEVQFQIRIHFARGNS
jgi:predicted DNA-binding ribbon-helix-helix protein